MSATAAPLVIVGASMVLLVAALAVAARARRERRPHAPLVVRLTGVGCVALAASLILAELGLATAATPRFYHGMLTGLGFGALLAAIIIYLADVRKR